MHDWQRAEDALIERVQVPEDWDLQTSGTNGATGQGNPFRLYALPEQYDVGAVRAPDTFATYGVETSEGFANFEWEGLNRPPDILWYEVAAWRGTEADLACSLDLFVASSKKGHSSAVLNAACRSAGDDAQSMDSVVDIPSFGGFILVMIAVTGSLSLIFGALLWGILRKGGRPGWHALVPIYVWVELARVGKRNPAWGWLFGIGPALGFVASFLIPGGSWLPAGLVKLFTVLFVALWILFLTSEITIFFGVARAFGKDGWWVLGFLCLPYVFFPILGYGRAEYIPEPDAAGHATGLFTEPWDELG